ncbi:ribonuclease Z [Tenacibaculum sp. UWU-22]|uniref:ribonuclease Z n=1 Tax=Tenacibaculum sp. UWU-22 TaxID=3234187 RepID=UPI0034DB6E20
MTIKEKESYILIVPDQDSFVTFFKYFKEKHSEFEKKSIIIEFLDKFNITQEDIFVFLKYAELHRKNGTSFVIVLKDVNIDDFPETFNIVPTLVEAEDVIEMEGIERDLGF